MTFALVSSSSTVSGFKLSAMSGLNEPEALSSKAAWPDEAFDTLGGSRYISHPIDSIFFSFFFGSRAFVFSHTIVSVAASGWSVSLWSDPGPFKVL